MVYYYTLMYFARKSRMIINEKQRLEVLGINGNDESDAAPILTFHDPQHDALVEHFLRQEYFHKSKLMSTRF